MKPTDQEILLGDALRSVLVKAGVLSSEAEPTGPELLLAAKDFVDTTEEK